MDSKERKRIFQQSTVPYPWVRSKEGRRLGSGSGANLSFIPGVEEERGQSDGELALSKPGAWEKLLAAAARENDISGLVAYTSPHNQGMIKLFKQLPYRVNTFFDGDMLTLKCKFNEPV